ncbi:MAG TPA: Na+/H+ antiporter NhaA [Nitrospirae bacterium]|nr:Na+/H+ antiporter NhaA [Nitrospirota bacterium]
MIGFIKRLLQRREITPHLIRPFHQFFKKEASSSIVLMLATAVALVWANSPAGDTYHHFWETPLTVSLGSLSISLSLREWINEGLMAVFFFVVGLEIKREVLVGELSSIKKAFLPVGAALGGMIVPAAFYFIFNYGSETMAGWAIPMATDIAFALGVLYVLGNRVPAGLRVFLSAFAIADDLGAVLVIALFYTKGIVVSYLFISIVIVAIIAVASYFWIRNTLFYVLMAILLWFAFLGSGLHSTVAGIIIAMFIPASGRYNTDRFLEEVGYYLGKFRCPPEGCGESILLNQEHLSAVQSIEVACHHVETPLQRLEHVLHPWVAYLVIPLFALANAGLSLKGIAVHNLITSPVTLGVILGLVIGKPLGITLFTLLSVKTGLSVLPYRVKWAHILGAGMLGGIGFTMSLFISALSFSDANLMDQAKMGILLASVISGVMGILVLYLVHRRVEREL